MEFSKRIMKIGGTSLVLSAAVFLTFGAFAQAEPEFSFNDNLEKIKVKGDIRVRHEHFEHSPTGSSASSDDRDRQRVRLRIGADFALPHNLTVKTRFATGSDQNSTNQTFDNAGTRKAFDLDRAYLAWALAEWLEIDAGKMANPFEGSYSSDLAWDTDLNPEGAAQKLAFKAGDNTEIFLNFLQFAVNEVGSDTEDVYDFSEQLGVKTKLGESKLAAAIAHHEVVNFLKNGTGSADSAGGGNTGSSGFSVLEIGANAMIPIIIPVTFDVTYVQNNAAKKVDLDGDGTSEEEDTGIQAGVILGKAKKQGSVEGALFYKEVEADAVLNEFTDSDFNGTNRKGWIAWVAYAISDNVKATIKHFDNEKKVVAAGADTDDMNRTQFDLSVKF